MITKKFRSLEGAALAGILGLSTMLSSEAAVGSGTSSSSALNLGVGSTVDLQALVLTDNATAGINAQALAPASGLAPNTYTVTHGPLAYVNNGATIGLAVPNPVFPIGPVNLVSTTSQTLRVSADALNDSASSTVDGGSGNKVTTATTAVTGLSVQFGVLNSTALGIPLAATAALNISADALSSSAQVQGVGDGVSAFISTASSSITNLNVSIFGASILTPSVLADLQAGVAVDITVDLSLLTGLTLPAQLANVSLTGQIRIYNTHTTTDTLTNGTASAAALGIEFTNVGISADVLGGAGVINTDVALTGGLVVGQANAAQAVPEPSSAALLIGAGFLLASRMRGSVRGRSNG